MAGESDSVERLMVGGVRWLIPVALTVAAWAAERPPNVVLIISDDHGWTDYGFMGNDQVLTPRIDQLAKEGLTFTRGYVPTSLCRPSLASMMTGLYPHQHRVWANDPKGDARNAEGRERIVSIYRQSKTLAGLLADRGYVSFESGKWWEGGYRNGGFSEGMTHGEVARGGRHGDEGLKIGRESMKPVLDFIDRAVEKPFFLWYAPMMPHTPHNPPERLLSKYKDKHPLDVAKYYAMIEWFDETVGELLNHLDKRGLRENTLVAYLADNGWVQKPTLFEGRAKMSPYEAGVRTPVILRRPGKIAARREEQSLASSVDLAPTILAALGMKPPSAMTGINLLKQKRDTAFGAIFTHTAVDEAAPISGLKCRWMVRGRWKLVAPQMKNAALLLWPQRPETMWATEVELYDVVADPQERDNVAARNPKVVEELRRELERWWRVD